VAERWARDPMAELAAVCDFLGVPPLPHVMAGAESRNVTASRRVDTWSTRLARRVPGYHRALRIAPPELRARLYRMTTRRLPASQLSDAARQRVAEALAPDRERLEQLLGPIPEWDRDKSAAVTPGRAD